jgi:hypothetical protein
MVKFRAVTEIFLAAAVVRQALRCTNALTVWVSRGFPWNKLPASEMTAHFIYLYAPYKSSLCLMLNQKSIPAFEETSQIR